MVATSHDRGHLMFWNGDVWCYENALDYSVCVRCGKPPTLEGHDACLGHIDGAVGACCGHGVSKPTLMMDTHSMAECHL